MAAAAPSLLFDYYGFPEHTYRLRYAAPGSPELAERIGTLLRSAGIASEQTADRGLDHGVFVPFLRIYPKADIPIVQLSLRAGLDPAEHLAAGRALAPLRDAALIDWAQAPAAHASHPREEHLLPLMMVAGAAGTDRGSRVYHDQVVNFIVSGYRFG